MNTSEFPKKYCPKDFEKNWYTKWMEDDCFSPKPPKTKRKFYIPIPPPNVTGVLHLGHALTLTLEDIMVRYHRMCGDETLWVPGTDHAGIATQNKVEKRIVEQGSSLEQLGRDGFTQKAWEWKDEYHKTISDQIKAMGASVDWSKERFTLDDGLHDQVIKSFVALYNEKLIFRGEYMVNYCPKQQTVISDAEVVYKEEEGKMYDIVYFVSGSDKQLIVSTTRPETLLADQAVAVHPKDKRYKKLIGRNVILPILNKEIPIIADEMVDMEFGTGAVKITPAHDPNDFEVAKRHDLRKDYSVIDKNGNMNSFAGELAGMSVEQAREIVVGILKSKGNLKDVRNHTHRVGYSERGDVRVENIVSTQWFVDAAKMKKKVMAGWKKKEFRIIPDRFGKIFEDWMEKMHEWCISRQLWWGHRIPAYYLKETDELLGVTDDPSDIYKKHGEENVYQDADVLDTWFSSALWPFGVLDYDIASKTPSELFKKFYPADVLETGYDIIFFWVIRMLLFGYHFTDQTPFKDIYLHGLITDSTGKKFSKSLGNGIDPIKVIDEYSSDALRLSVVVGNTPGNNFKFGMDIVEKNRLFLNKLWNVIRFVSMNIGTISDSYSDLHKKVQKHNDEFLPHEKWILSRLAYTIKNTTEGMEKYTFSSTGQQLYTFVRDEFSDYFIEAYKATKEDSKHANTILAYVTMSILKLWHPYIPFITEELYSRITDGKEVLMLSEWVKTDLEQDTAIEKEMESIFEVVSTLRNIRAENGIKPNESIAIQYTATPKYAELIGNNINILKGLVRIDSMEKVASKEKVTFDNYAFGSAKHAEMYIEIQNFDPTEEIERLKLEIADKKEYIRLMDIKLTNPNFVNNAPKEIVLAIQEKKHIAEKQLTKLKSQLESLS